MSSQGSLIQESIANHCETHGITINRLAKSLGISSGQLGKLAVGESSPALSTLQAMAKCFKWSKSEIGSYVLECKVARAGPRKVRK